jgi:predicted secreted acid phosphatase
MREKAIIVDIDGTIANNSHRVRFVDGSQVKDWDQFNALSANDPVNEWCRDMVYGLHDQGYKIVFLTARNGSKETREMTERWLKANIRQDIPYVLYMREVGDTRTDFISKEEIYLVQIAPYYDVVMAIDDKRFVCDMWLSLGIVALHCSDY